MKNVPPKAGGKAELTLKDGTKLGGTLCLFWTKTLEAFFCAYSDDDLTEVVFVSANSLTTALSKMSTVFLPSTTVPLPKMTPEDAVFLESVSGGEKCHRRHMKSSHLIQGF